MKIKKFEVGYLQTNCYVVTADNQKDAVIIDAGGGYEKINEYLAQNNKRAAAVLLTHGHFDHILATKKLQEGGAEVYIHLLDRGMLTNGESLASEMGIEIESFCANHLFLDGDTIKIGELSFKVIHTPGHTKGSSCFIIEDNIFSGDTLFLGSYGRTDFAGGSMSSMQKSLKKLFDLTGDYKVFPGHMDNTTLDYERKYNPIQAVTK